MEVRYVGGSDGVIVPAVGEEPILRGATVAVPDELAASLLEQDVWERVTPVRGRAKPEGGDS